jgi:hypothetical protein
MRLDDKLALLKVAETNCARNCVVAGGSGERIFQLPGPGVAATLTKQVTCARDAEVCGGLAAGYATLSLSTAAGSTVMRVWGEYCDM